MSERRTIISRTLAVVRTPVVGSVAVVGGVFILVEYLSRSGAVDRITLIPATEMVAGFGELIGDPKFWTEAMLPTFRVAAGSFVFAALVGILLGYWIWRSRAARRWIEPYLYVYYAVPVFALYPVAIIVFGLGPLPVFLIAGMFGTVVIAVHTLTGFDAVNALHYKLADALRLSSYERMRYILLPSATPSIVAGMKLGLSYCIVATIAVEFILSAQGVGRLIGLAYNSFDLRTMYGGMLAILLVTVTSTLLLAAVERRISYRYWETRSVA